MLHKVSDAKFWSFANECRGHADMSVPLIVFAAYATLCRQGGCREEQLPDEELADEISHFLGEDQSWLPVGEYTNDELIAIILKNDVSPDRVDNEHSTPQSMAATAAGLLRMDANKSILDLGCGTGNFMIEAAAAALSSHFTGIEINFDAASVSRIRAKFLPSESKIVLGNLFEFAEHFDYVFCDGPMGMSVRSFERHFGVATASLVPDSIKVSSGSWLWALVALKCCNEGGRAVVTMPGGPLINRSDSDIRKYLVSSGCIESVTALPKGLNLPYTSVSTYLLVLSEGNNSVRMVDATRLGQKERRATVLNDGDIRKICSMSDSSIPATSFDESCVSDSDTSSMESNDWSFNPVRYMKVVDIDDGVPLSSLITSITRGASIPARELDGRIVDKDTPYRYLQIGNLADGEISDKLPHLSSIDEKELKYCVDDGDIVLGKMSPFKAAVASFGPGMHVLATGNLYIIKPDTEAVDPIYLKLFLESPQGIAQLKASCVGTKIPSVPVSAFDRILVPSKPLKEQKKIANQYRALRQSIGVYEFKIEQAKDEIASLFEGEDD